MLNAYAIHAHGQPKSGTTWFEVFINTLLWVICSESSESPRLDECSVTQKGSQLRGLSFRVHPSGARPAGNVSVQLNTGKHDFPLALAKPLNEVLSSCAQQVTNHGWFSTPQVFSCGGGGSIDSDVCLRQLIKWPPVLMAPPSTRFMLILRDPRAILLACASKSSYAKDIESLASAASLTAAATSLRYVAHTRFTSDTLVLFYEEMRRDTAAALIQIVSWLGLPKPPSESQIEQVLIRTNASALAKAKAVSPAWRLEPWAISSYAKRPWSDRRTVRETWMMSFLRMSSAADDTWVNGTTGLRVSIETTLNADQVALINRAVCTALVPQLRTRWPLNLAEATKALETNKSLQAKPRSPAKALCSGHGVCFFGECFCEPGYLGKSCEEIGVPPKPCGSFKNGDAARYYTGHQDVCLQHPEYGAALAPAARWMKAQHYERETMSNSWRSSVGHGQWGAMEATHERAEKQYNVTWRELEQGLPHGLNLGRVAEVGCGPHMQLFGLLWFRPDLQVEQISAIDPGMPGYIKAGATTYANGTLLGRYPVEMLPIGAEQLPACYSNSFDAVVFVNIIEHTFNAFAALYQAYRLLRPGGLFIINERIVKLESPSQVFHPIRLKRAFFEEFLSRHFEPPLYQSPGPGSPELTPERQGRLTLNKWFLDLPVHFVGRKK